MRVPGNPLGRAVDAAAHGPDFARRVTALVPRAGDLLDAAERLIGRLDAMLGRLEHCEVQIEAVVERVSASELAARSVIGQVAHTHRRVQTLLDHYEPVLSSAAPTGTYAAERVGPEQIDAVLGLLGGLGTVAPDLRELIALSRGLNELMASVPLPGMSKAKRRVDEELEDLQREADDPNSPRA